MPSRDIRKMLENVTVVPVLSFTEVDSTLDIIGNMIDAGLSTIELTMRSPVARETLRAAKDRFGGDACIGMGTIMTPAQLEDVVSDGADFGVSPGLNGPLLDAISESPMPFLPGVATVSEAMTAQDRGISVMKFFPAEQAGGAPYLKSIGAVLPKVQFCPTGGVTSANAKDYLDLSNIICVGTTGLTALARPDTYNKTAFQEQVAAFGR